MEIINNFVLYFCCKKKNIHLNSKNKNIFKRSISALIIWLALVQFLVPLVNPTGLELGAQNKTEDTIVTACMQENSPGKVENQVKKFDRVSENESNEYNHFTKQKFVENFEVENYTQIKLLYTLHIINTLNNTKFSLNHLDLRSPPTLIS